MEKLNVAIGADHAGFELKEKIVAYLKANNIEYKDFGTYSTDACDYPKIGKEVAEEVAKGNFNKGILVCGSGIGMSIAANKVNGAKAALCWNMQTAKSSRTHNDANILCLAARVTEHELVLEMVDLWLKTEFLGGRHQTRVDMIEG